MAAIIAATLIASVWLQGSALEDRFFDSNGVRIRYVEQGRGPAVVLIHRYTGNGDRHWVNTGVFARLAADHRVIAIDCRGHGKSAQRCPGPGSGVCRREGRRRLVSREGLVKIEQSSPSGRAR